MPGARIKPKAGSGTKEPPLALGGDGSHEKHSELSEGWLRWSKCGAHGNGLNSELRIDALSDRSATSSKRLLASYSVHSTKAPTGDGSRNGSRLWPLFALAFFTLMSFATALECNIDLSLISSSSANPGFAQCDAGCDSCTFSILGNGLFQYGTVECLPKVPCVVEVNSHANYAMHYATVNGSQASALSVDTNNAYFPWPNAEIHTPANRGDFQFVANNTQSVLEKTTFYAVNSGVVDIVIHSDGLYHPSLPTLYSVFVYASTAKELNVFLGADTQFSKYLNSEIHCPNFGKCQWQSNAQRYDAHIGSMAVVNMFAAKLTVLRLLCEENSTSCDGVVVHCGDDTCDMEYASDWQCVGSLDLDYDATEDVWQCPFWISTTTATPETTVQHSDSGGNGWKPVVYAVIAVFLAMFCFVVAVIGYFSRRNRQIKGQVLESPKELSVSSVDTDSEGDDSEERHELIL